MARAMAVGEREAPGVAGLVASGRRRATRAQAGRAPGPEAGLAQGEPEPGAGLEAALARVGRCRDLDVGAPLCVVLERQQRTATCFDLALAYELSRCPTIDQSNDLYRIIAPQGTVRENHLW
jgi:hypothetical protein